MNFKGSSQSPDRETLRSVCGSGSSFQEQEEGTSVFNEWGMTQLDNINLEDF